MQREIEKWSPQILGHDEEIWRQFIKRDAPGFEAKSRSPSDGNLWYEIYLKAVAQSKKEVAEDERILKAKMDEIKMHQTKHTSRQVDATTVPKLPQIGGMQYVRYLKTLDGEDYTPHKHRRVGLVQPTTKLTFGTASRMKAKTGPQVLEKARREAREHKLLTGQLAIPTHKLPKQASRVRQVPYSMLVDHLRAAAAVPQPIDPTVKPTEVFVPKRKRVAAEEEPTGSEPSSSNDEERPIKKPKMATAVAVSPEEAKIQSKELLALVNELPQPQPQPVNPAGKPVRPPMKAKRPVSIFLPSKRR